MHTQVYQYDVQALDPDGDSLTFKLQSGSLGMSIDRKTGVISFSDVASKVISGQVINPMNGHAYYLLAPSRWTDAENVAVSLGGHLATFAISPKTIGSTRNSADW